MKRLNLPAVVTVDCQQSIIDVAAYVQCLSHQGMEVMLALAPIKAHQGVVKVVPLLAEDVSHHVREYRLGDRYTGNGALI
ncbi:hypothetical protein D3C71_1917890 [compost metagenome]